MRCQCPDAAYFGNWESHAPDQCPQEGRLYWSTERQCFIRRCSSCYGSGDVEVTMYPKVAQ